MNIPLMAGIILISLFIGGLIGATLMRVFDQFRRMEMTINDLTEKIEKLETCQKTRNPYRTNEGLENAMAIVNDAVYQADATLDYVRGRMQQVNTTLKTIRKEPDKYNPDEPNKKRLVI